MHVRQLEEVIRVSTMFAQARMKSKILSEKCICWQINITVHIIISAFIQINSSTTDKEN